MKKSIIVAMTENYVIGKDNKLPWHIPEDLKRFKKITLGKPVIMGRKTFESIGHPLINRTNIVLSKDKSFKADGIIIANSIADALALSPETDEVFFIGGAKVFEEAYDIVDNIYLTLIHYPFEGDTFFPYKNLFDKFQLEKNGFLLFRGAISFNYSVYTGKRRI